MQSWFARHDGADPVPLNDELPGPARRLFLADRACCCPARPVVTVVIPAGRGHPHPADLLLCGHHYRANLAALRAVGADVYDQTGLLIMTGDRATAYPPRGRRGSRIAAGFLLALACQRH
jgi:hypothetical protein